MNIIYYSHYFTPEIGAPSARIHDLSKEWIASGHPVQVVTCFPNHPSGRLYPDYERRMYMEESLDGIRVHRHWTFITPNKGFIKKTMGHISFWPSAVLLSNPRLEPFDVAIASSPTFFAAFSGVSASKKYKVPFVMEIRDLWPAIFIDLGVIRNRQVIRLLEKLEIYLYRQATSIVTVTEAFKNNLIDRGIPPQKIYTIPNGADVEYWKPLNDPADLREKLGLKDSFVVLYIGAHGISHALGRVLESAIELRDQKKIFFLFVGEGAEKAELVRKAKELNLRNVFFHEAVDKESVRRFYTLADVCLVPLRNIPLFDSFIPSKMFEIMAMKRPIVGSVRGEAADILRQSKGALVLEPENPRAIAESILYLYRHKDERETMGQEGRKFVVENYSRRSMARKYLEVLSEAVDLYKKAS